MAEARVSPITVRPAEAQDAGLQQAFFAGLSHESRYHRFMSPLREVPAALLDILTRVDQDRHVALLAEADGAVIGEARYVRDGEAAEFAVAVADAWQGRGLGRSLLAALETRAIAAGVHRLAGDTLRGNAGMIALGRRAGFAIRPGAGGLWTVRLVKDIVADARLAA
jgi:acetyltransferase